MDETAAAATEPRYWPRRHTLVLLAFAALFICYIDRVNISVAIIPMARDMGWDTATQGAVLSSFFVGYLLTQVVGGRLADRYGGKMVLGVGVVFWSLFTLLTPLAAAAGMIALFAARIGLGVFEGVTLPAIHSMLGRWLPRDERSRAVGVVFSAMPLGTVFALLLTPVIVLRFGWEWAFYAFGAMGFVWWALWQLQVADDPASHPGITAHERALINADTTLTMTPAPALRDLLSRGPVWAIIVAHFCTNWSGYVLLAWMPKYVNEGLGVEFASVGLFAFVPQMCAFLALNAAGVVADRMVRSGGNVTRTRKTLQTIGFAGAATALMLVGYVHDATQAIALMSLGSIIGAFGGAGGWGSNHLDIAPRHAGVVMGLSNTAATIPGIVGVYASGLILQWTHSWTLVFQVAAGVYLFGMVFYLIFASGERIYD